MVRGRWLLSQDGPSGNDPWRTGLPSRCIQTLARRVFPIVGVLRILGLSCTMVVFGQESSLPLPPTLGQFTPELSDDEIVRTIEDLRAHVIQKHEQIGLSHLQTPQPQSLAHFIRKHKNHPGLLLLEPNPVVAIPPAKMLPNDPLFWTQWTLARIAANEPLYPAAFPHVIGVAATDVSDHIWVASNYGAHVDLAAPGVNILSTGLSDGYVVASGTSFSAAYVSGVAALVRSHYLHLSNTHIEHLLYYTADDLGVAGRDEVYGFGRINAAQAHRMEP